MTDEFARFLTLFDQMALFTEAWLDKMPPGKIDWAPIENSSMRFGDRVSRITAKGLILHICVGERHWITQIPASAPGGVIAIPKNPDLERSLAAGDFRDGARAMHRENMDLLKAYRREDLDKAVVFADRQYTGIGLLWAMYAHRAFHLGNIDIYLRQTDTIAPDFFRFPSGMMA